MREVETILRQYEAGRMTRRQMIGYLSTLVASTGPVVAAESSFKAVNINHIALSVTDVARSRDFYKKHLGLEVTREGGNNCFLSFGSNFLALFPGPKPEMQHYCYSVAGYNVENAARKLREAGIEPEIESNRIYFPDPDGLTVQLASPDHRA